MTLESLFFELLQVTVNHRSQLSVIPTSEEWVKLGRISDKQSLTGVVLHGINKLPEEQRPPKGLLLDWIGQSIIIRERNLQVTRACKKLVASFAQAGFKTCILKGQSNHAYYIEDTGSLRICGDVDVWVVPDKRKGDKEDAKRVLKYVYKNFQVESLCWLHIELKPIESVPVEIHLRPSFFNSPLRNKRLLRYLDFEKVVCQKDIDGVPLPVLKAEYDVVFQLNHLYRHLLDEGIGLRQVVDYYYLLMSFEKYDMQDVVTVIKKMGMWKFAGALMYVMQVVLAMKREYMICEPLEKEGRFLLYEIMTAGNFGHYDPRMTAINVKKGRFSYQVKHALRRIKRNMRFLCSYPEEVIWEPFARVSHWGWKLNIGLGWLPRSRK